MSVLATSTPVIGTREEGVEAIKAIGTTEAIEGVEIGEEDKKSKGEYPKLVRVPCIW